MPVRNFELLNNLVPNNGKIIEICKEYNALGIHAFTLEAVGDANAHTRNFAPLVGIDEESATGTANGALACYMYKYFDSSVTNYKMGQGYTMGKPSEITVQLEVKKNNILEVNVGGKAKIIEFY